MELEILCSKSGERVVKMDNILLCSKYDPINEAKILINSYEHILQEDIIHVVGIGAGYHIKELLSRINNKQVVKVYEENYNLYDLQKDELSKEIKNKKLQVFFRNQLNDFITTLNQSSDIIIHKPSMKIMKDKKVQDLFDRFVISKDSINKFSQMMIINERENIKNQYLSINHFVNNINSKMIVVASAGPSLDDVVEKVKIYRDKFKIFAVGAALRTLMENGITPDLIVITDPQEIVAEQLRGYENSNIPLAFLSTASRWAVERYNGPKYIFFNKKVDDNMIIETGKTVAVSAIDLAIKSNCEKVIMIGQDLAYLHNKTHANSYKRIYGVDDEIKINNKTEYIKGITGEMLMTTRVYLIFKRDIEKLIKKNNSIDFYNCSLGADILGAKNVEIETLL